MVNLSTKGLCNIIYRESLFDNYRFYKHFINDFNEDYFPCGLYRVSEAILNPRWSSYFVEHKCNLSTIVPEKNLPKTLLKITNGYYTNNDNSPLTKEEARKILYDSPTFFAKMALAAGGGGKSVYRIDPTTQEGKANIEQLLEEQHVIFQAAVKQSQFFSDFNETSVNTMRLLSLFINGKVSVLSSFIRMGGKGSFVDNVTSGGCCVGVHQNGELNEWAFDKSFKKIHNAPSGIPFKGLSVPNYEGIKEQIISIHQNIPYARLIGWDLCVDENNELKVIEINLDTGGLEKHQCFNGPIFGDRTQEVMDFLQKQVRHSSPKFAAFFS